MHWKSNPEHPESTCADDHLTKPKVCKKQDFQMVLKSIQILKISISRKHNMIIIDIEMWYGIVDSDR